VIKDLHDHFQKLNKKSIKMSTLININSLQDQPNLKNALKAVLNSKITFLAFPENTVGGLVE
jgi:hypothetical protein